ncbi:MAG TPA: VOC family protein [Methylomirabilota bacterium]|nr:VOC family protein [Methylomirabilota bacterium]
MSEIRFDHVAIAVSRMADAPAVLVGALGGVPTGEGGPSGAYAWAQWGFAGGGRLEILEPLGEDGFLHRFLAARGPGIHHVTFRVPSLCDACGRAVAHGYRIVGYDDSDPRWAEAFLHPKEALGIVVQLAESRGTDAAAAPALAAPPGPPDPPPAVTLVGLRTRARSVERADTQWGRVLQGRRGQAGGSLVYRWPDSPLRVAVEVDPDAEEGPIAIEFAGARTVGLPRTRHPVLGAVFRRGTA